MQARTDSTRGRCGGGRDDRAGGVAVGASESGLEAADEDAGAGLREVVGGLVGGGNVGQADGAVADHLLPQPVPTLMRAPGPMPETTTGVKDSHRQMSRAKGVMS